MSPGAAFVLAVILLQPAASAAQGAAAPGFPADPAPAPPPQAPAPPPPPAAPALVAPSAPALVVVPAPAAPPRAQAPGRTSATDDRALGGHTFLFPLLQEHTPFAATHFGIRQGFAFASYPQVPLGQLGNLDLKLSGLTQTFDVSLRLTDWLAFQASGGGIVVTGVDVSSIVLTGASFSGGAEGGLLLRLLRSERTGTQVAAYVGASASTGRDVTVLPLVQALVNTPNQTLDTILNGNIGRLILVPTSERSWRGSLIAAQALTPYIGLLASAALGYGAKTKSPFDAATGTSSDVTSTELEVTGAVALTLDGSPAGFPLALMVEYEARSRSDKTPDPGAPGAELSESELSHLVGGGIYYSGRRDLQLGVGLALQAAMKPLEGVDANGQPAPSGAPSLFLGQFILRYVW